MRSFFNALPLWSVLAVILFLFFVFAALSRCADSAATAHFCHHVTTHPDLRTTVEEEDDDLDEEFDDDDQFDLTASTKRRRALEHQIAVGAAEQKRSRTMWCRSLGVAAMNWTCLRACFRKGSMLDRRNMLRMGDKANDKNMRFSQLICSCTSRDKGLPAVESLAFLPDAYASALYSRYLKYLLIHDDLSRSQRILRKSGRLGNDSSLHHGISRVIGPPAAVAAVSAAEDDIARAVDTKGTLLRIWRFRWTILHVWAVQVCLLSRRSILVVFLYLYTLFAGFNAASNIFFFRALQSGSSPIEPPRYCSCHIGYGVVHRCVLLLRT